MELITSETEKKNHRIYLVLQSAKKFRTSDFILVGLSSPLIFLFRFARYQLHIPLIFRVYDLRHMSEISIHINGSKCESHKKREPK